jgi:hypothetical protein
MKATRGHFPMDYGIFFGEIRLENQLSIQK